MTERKRLIQKSFFKQIPPKIRLSQLRSLVSAAVSTRKKEKLDAMECDNYHGMVQCAICTEIACSDLIQVNDHPKIRHPRCEINGQ